MDVLNLMVMCGYLNRSIYWYAVIDAWNGDAVMNHVVTSDREGKWAEVREGIVIVL